MHCATAFNANHSLEGPVDAHWSENVNFFFFFLQKCAYFSIGDYCVQNLSYQLQTGFKRILKG